MRVAVAPSLSTVGGAYGIDKRSRGVSSRATIGVADGFAEDALSEDDDVDDGDGTAACSHAMTDARSMMPSQRIVVSLPTTTGARV